MQCLHPFLGDIERDNRLHILGLNFKFRLFFDFAKPKFMHCRMVVHFLCTRMRFFLGGGGRAFRATMPYMFFICELLLSSLVNKNELF